MQQVIVTRHPALVELLQEWGVVDGSVEVIPHATTEQVRGKHVIGVLPLHLAAEAAMVTEVPLRLTPEMRGRELNLEKLREVASLPVTYEVRRV